MRLILATTLLLTSSTVAASQAPDAEIFLVSLSSTGGKLSVTGARNLTNRPGYDNQPNWSRDGATLYFTSTRADSQADIYRIEPAGSAPAVRVTLTAPESEYSATPMPRRNAISVIRVERDSTQRLWSVPLDGSAGAPVFERIKPVGYHTWVNDTLLALFVLGSPNTLQLASSTTGRADTIATGIGRSLHTTKDGQVSFVHKVSNDEWWLTLLDPATKQTRRLVRMPNRVEDYAWTPDGRVLAGQGSVLKSFDPARGGEWETVADLASHGLQGISRLSVSPRGDAVAVVAQPVAPGRD
jgi:dipeptidyl aminopeptidase/acylaminoacyl peptidase